MRVRATVLRDAIRESEKLRRMGLRVAVPIYNKGYVFQGTLQKTAMQFGFAGSKVYYRQVGAELKKNKNVQKHFPEHVRWKS